MSTICQKYFYFKLFGLFKQLYITIQFSASTVSMSKTVQFQTIQFSISTQFKCKYSLPDICLAVRVFANGPGDLSSIPGRVIPKTQKMVLDASLLNTQHYKVRIKGKVEQSREGVAPSPTPWCSSYRKGSLRDYPRLWSPTTTV